MMRFSTLIKHPADWMRGSGPHSDIVMTSRVRLARNLRGFPFPGYSHENQRIQLMDMARPIIEELPEMKDGFSQAYADLAKIPKQVLVERHLISREHAARSAGCAVAVDRKQSISLMINEEDHFRIQGIRPGLDLRSAYEVVDRVDTELEDKLPYAFDGRLGSWLPHGLPDQSWDGHARLGDAALAGPGDHRSDQSGGQGGRQDRPRRAWVVWRRDGGVGQSLPDFESAYPR
jgi:hypothetical protein